METYYGANAFVLYVSFEFAVPFSNWQGKAKYIIDFETNFCFEKTAFLGL